MLPTTLRLALRRITRRPGTVVVHVGGLAVGLGCCFLALLFVRDELSYDRFHPGAGRIVEVWEHARFGDSTGRFFQTPAGGREALTDRTAGIEAVTETTSQPGLVRSAPHAEGVVAGDVRFADASFFDVFAFPLAEGSAQTALVGPNRAVLTAALARTLFGAADAVGRQVYVERAGIGVTERDPIALMVTGIAVDPPSATSVQFDLLVSGTTRLATPDSSTAPALGGTGATFVRVASLRDTAAVQAALNPLAFAADNSFAGYGDPMGVFTPRLVDMHLSNGGPLAWRTGRAFSLILFSAVALLVLLLACINYANLATALALSRATEIGIRKALGAGRTELARQFLAEAVALALGAAVLGVGLVAVALPAFNAFFDKGVSLAGLGLAEWSVVAILAVAGGLVAGAYPAFVLTRLGSSAAFTSLTAQRTGRRRVQQVLVVFQFAVTAVLLAATSVVGQQLDAAQTGGPGFDGDRVAVFDLSADRLRQVAAVLKREVEAAPGVERASLGSAVPGGFGMKMGMSPPTTNDDATDDVTASYLLADAQYRATFGIALAAGAWFAPDAVSADEVVLNETAARALHLMTTDPAAAIGKPVGSGVFGETPTVVGVVQDFHFDGPRLPIGPLFVQPMTDAAPTLSLAVQMSSADARTVAAVRDAWERVAPDYPFEPRFVSDTFADQMREDWRLGQLLRTFGFVAVLLGCLGVFGLAAHSAQRRTKEVGVRKVLGATVAGLVARLSGEFARLVAVALVVAAPPAWWLAQRWLEGFAYPAPLSAVPFVLVGVGVLALALLAAGVHAVRAATADPVRALRSE